MSNEKNAGYLNVDFLQINEFEDITRNLGNLSDAIRFLWLHATSWADDMDDGFCGALGAVADNAQRICINVSEYEPKPRTKFDVAYDKLTPDEREKVLQYVDLIISAREVV